VTVLMNAVESSPNLTASTDDEKVPIDAELRKELDDFAEAGGHRDFHAWVGTENYEMRVDPGLDWIDQRILAIVRQESGRGSEG